MSKHLNEGDQVVPHGLGRERQAENLRLAFVTKIIDEDSVMIRSCAAFSDGREFSVRSRLLLRMDSQQDRLRVLNLQAFLLDCFLISSSICFDDSLL